MFLERLRNALNRGMNQELDRRTSKELSEAVPQTDILGIVFCLTTTNLILSDREP